MALSKQDARTAVEIGSLTVGSFAFVFPRAAGRVFGAGGDGATATLVRVLGARSLTYGAVLSTLDSEDDAELLLMAGAASASADCLTAIVGAATGKLRKPGALLTAAVSGTLAGLACWSLVEKK